jgi:hypothetical protein
LLKLGNKTNTGDMGRHWSHKITDQQRVYHALQAWYMGDYAAGQTKQLSQPGVQNGSQDKIWDTENIE